MHSAHSRRRGRIPIPKVFRLLFVSDTPGSRERPPIDDKSIRGEHRTRFVNTKHEYYNIINYTPEFFGNDDHRQTNPNIVRVQETGQYLTTSRHEINPYNDHATAVSYRINI